MQTIEATAQFLQNLHPQMSLHSIVGSINSSYLDRAIRVSEQIDIEKILKERKQAAGHLQYNWADSGCSAQQGLVAMGELLGRASRVDAVIGPGCSSACEVTSYLSSGQDLPQISWGCAASSLSNKEKYRLVRLPAVVSSVNMLYCVVSSSCNCSLFLCSSRALLRPT